MGFEFEALPVENDRALLHSDGAGIITSNVDNDAGGITTYSLAGARIRTQTDLVPDPDYDRPDRDPGDVRSHGRGDG